MPLSGQIAFLQIKTHPWIFSALSFSYRRTSLTPHKYFSMQTNRLQLCCAAFPNLSFRIGRDGALDTSGGGVAIGLGGLDMDGVESRFLILIFSDCRFSGCSIDVGAFGFHLGMILVLTWSVLTKCSFPFPRGSTLQ